jgi:hypothetical protein
MLSLTKEGTVLPKNTAVIVERIQNKEIWLQIPEAAFV